METKTNTNPDPTALGLFGLAIVTLVASSQKLGITEGTMLIIPWTIFLGGLVQIVAGIFDYKKGNIFGGTAFSAYGFFWLAVGLSWFTQFKLGTMGMSEVADSRQLGVAFLGYLIFTAYMTVASLETNKVLLVIFILIDVLFLGLTLNSFGIMASEAKLVAGIAEFAISMAAFYGSAANIFKCHLGYELIPAGKPCGILTKKQ